MKQRPRIYYTEAQKALMWDRWKAGGTLHEIGKLFDLSHPKNGSDQGRVLSLDRLNEPCLFVCSLQDVSEVHVHKV